MKRRVAVVVIGILIAIGGADGESQEAELKAGATLGGNAQKSPLYPTIETFPTIVDARHANTEAVDLFMWFDMIRGGSAPHNMAPNAQGSFGLYYVLTAMISIS